MRKMPSKKSHNADNDLLPEYHFNYEKAKPNRFATLDGKQLLKVVILDEDIAQVFTTPDSVNRVLRALIKTMPQVTLQPDNPIQRTD
jgi:hypothetical protein